MIPIRLEFQAFGSYVERQTVDFSGFKQGEIFLINGKTGSGKTTIIDAMVFALYGSGSGEDRNSLEQMRSYAYGAEKIPTEIEFTFEKNGKHYKFTRKCFTRTVNKRNGTQETVVETEHNAFEMIDGQFVPMFENPKIAAVNELATRLVGLTKEQFTKVMVLPQGKFESFLVADSKEKEEILCTLFNVTRWKRVADYLCEKALELSNTAKEKKALCENALKSYDCAKIDELEGLEESGIESHRMLTNELEDMEKKRSELYKKRESQLLVNDAFLQLEKAKKSHGELENQREFFENLKLETEKNRRALEVSPHVNFCKQFFEELKIRGNELENARKNLETIKRENLRIVEETEKITASQRVFDEQQKLLERLTDSRQSFEAISEKKKQEQALKEEILKKKQHLELEEKTVAKLGERASLLKKEKDDATAKLSRLAQLTAEKTAAEEFFALSQNVSAESKRLAEIDDEINSLVGRLSEAETDYETKKSARDLKYKEHIGNLAGTLAGALAEGEACPVCGSTHHPSAAKVAENAVTAEEITALDKTLELSGKVALELRNEKIRLEASRQSVFAVVEEMRKKLAEIKKYSPDEIEKIKEEYEESKSAADLISDINVKLLKADEEKETAEKSLLAISNEITESEKSLAVVSLSVAMLEKDIKKNGFENINTIFEADEIIEKLKASCEKYRGEKTRLEELKKSVETALTKAENALENADDEKEKAQKKYDEAVISYTKIMNEKGFSSKDEFKKFYATEQEISEKQKSTDEYFRNLSASSEQLKNLQKKTANAEKPDLLKLDKDIAAVDARHKELVSMISAVSEKNEAMKKALEAYKENSEAYEKLRDDGERLSRFGKDLRGDNSIGLRRFVLGVMLEKVIFEANNILREIKGGQFSLLVNREKQGKNHHFGLDLSVVSTKTDRPYSVRYLSGGEKFLVAMALSMALSSIVQMFAGGIQIDALFIDEGFGALDHDSLDEAMQVLTNMSSSRRVMGIISHVDVLKDAIQKKINVTSDACGSHLSLNF